MSEAARVWRDRLTGPLPVALAMLAACLLLFVGVTGPIRGMAGDVFVVIFLVAVLATAKIGRPRSRLIGIALLSVGVELFQGLGLVRPDAPWIFHLTVGSTFDPLDLLWYSVGLSAAAGLRVVVGRRPRAPDLTPEPPGDTVLEAPSLLSDRDNPRPGMWLRASRWIIRNGRFERFDPMDLGGSAEGGRLSIRERMAESAREDDEIWAFPAGPDFIIFVRRPH